MSPGWLHREIRHCVGCRKTLFPKEKDFCRACLRDYRQLVDGKIDEETLETRRLLRITKLGG